MLHNIRDGQTNLMSEGIDDNLKDDGKVSAPGLPRTQHPLSGLRPPYYKAEGPRRIDHKGPLVINYQNHWESTIREAVRLWIGG
ncbi:hypothetical protein GDO81_028245 [Engystomops pustulosus]|uniref:Uncharacterized protein n=1 Tax=Engystomops pustulosus TaxID=76066 RepID=A0AAV6YFT1_ENGPU|nr:hypothetical protein GDO81_028245 [Engystomops pustulosus]